MKARVKLWTIGLLFSGWLCFLFLSQLAAQTSLHSDIAVVVHPDSLVRNLSLDELRQYFLGDRPHWKGRAKLRVVLVMPAQGSRERDVLLKVIHEGVTEAQFLAYWAAKDFRAEPVPSLRFVYSNREASELVTANRGAIALIYDRDVRPGLEKVAVDGRLPGEPGYPLR